VGGEREHALMVQETALKHYALTRIKPAARIHAADHPSFEDDIACLAPAFGALAHIMLPKVGSTADIDRAAALIPAHVPLHALIESPAAVANVTAIAAHPRIASLSFGLMDFVSAHGGAIPAAAMTLHPTLGQFAHPAVLQAKLSMSAACHAHGKVPSHCVVTEFKEANLFTNAAAHAAQLLAYTRMWSIHPAQVELILAAFAPTQMDIDAACEIIPAAQAADWGTMNYLGKLHDRASYRYYWQVLSRAYDAGLALPAAVIEQYFQVSGNLANPARFH
jgi:citrate lyase subunit beta / citryl-CoA lyase